jgi:hypothetical protein
MWTMWTKVGTICAIAVAAVLWVRPSVGQVQPMPGPGSGIVTVKGTVNLGDVPPVNVTQLGEWKVAVTSAPAAVIAPLPFIKMGGRYQVVWNASEQEVVRITQLGTAGWFRVETAQKTLWLNLNTARSVEELR